MQNIKLVIWDLDETFWAGTLSEGKIVRIPAHDDLVIALCRRGIINGICSKNDLPAVREELSKTGHWDYFVFPEVGWTPKGPMVANILRRAQLRAENTLFVDDNATNLEEVRHYCPGINVGGPEILATLLDTDFCRGKPDPDLERLQQYKLMEVRSRDRETQFQDNDEFLKQSNIVVEFVAELPGHADRIYDLVSRANQLNFTKRRPALDEITRLLTAPGPARVGAIAVTDKYGSHGICGFYCVANGELEHFVFSCRILNLGIPSWLYNRIGRPKLQVQGAVAEGCELPTEKVAYIQEAKPSELTPKPSARLRRPGSKAKILMVGGCDLEQLVHFSGLENIETEFAGVNRFGISVHREHTSILRQLGQPPSDAEKTLEGLSIFEAADFRSKIFSTSWDVLIYSPLNDYSRGLYQSESGWRVPFDPFTIDWTEVRNWAAKPPHLQKLPDRSLELLRDRFTFVGGISPDEFSSNIRQLAASFPDRKIVVLTGAELEVPSAKKSEAGMRDRHVAMNRALVQVAASLGNVALLDVRESVRSLADVTDNLRHYKPSVYHKLAESLGSLLAADAPAMKNRRPRSNWLHAAAKFAGLLPQGNR